MLTAAILRIVDFCTRYTWYVIGAAVLLTILSAGYTARHFAIDTDVSKLISPELPWRQRELAFAAAFPHRDATILVVIDAPTPELAEQATSNLARRLSEQPALFKSVREPGGGPFFQENGLLFQSVEEVGRTTNLLMGARPLLGTLAGDPSLRGVLDGLAIGIGGVQAGQFKLDDLARPMTMLADTLDASVAGRPASFSWRVLMSGKPATTTELRRFIEVQPVLDFNALEPGAAASAAIRKAASDLKLSQDFGARVRLTGQVAIADEEFASLKEGAFLNTTLTILAVLLILWLALRSAKIIVAVFISLIVGLAVTAALGLMMVGALNLISVAFAVLFIGIGVDFGLQYSVRYRAERHDHDDVQVALLSAAQKAGGPLALAAAATTAGFWSFLPTDYRGLSELGLIAGSGMIIAFFTSITLLPVLLDILKPPPEPDAVGYRWLAPVDHFLETHRLPVIVGTLAVVILGLPLLYFLRFDSNPLNLRDPKTESISTYLELRNDPTTSGSSIELLAPSLPQADAAAARLAKLPEVERTMTLSSFIPEGQDEKLGLIQRAAGALDPVLNPPQTKPAPSDAETVAAARAMSDRLKQVAGDGTGPGVSAAKRLSVSLALLASADQAARRRAEAALIPPLHIALGGLRNSLKAQRVTLETLPAALTMDWTTPDGRARVDAAPKGDPADNEVLRRFAEAVLAVEPDATGMPVTILEAGRTIVKAFIEAGAWALLSITVLLWIALRRFTDVMLTLVPLILAGAVTLELCVIFGMPLNFANIIALPLLLGIGVAFKIYYITAWRSGKTNLLQSTLTRAVISSAMTTATAFGSLWLSNHPGTSSMGKLLALSLVCTMAAAVLFQPVLMGPPREHKKGSDQAL
ncbi:MULTISPECIES: MMPL family transporter [Rhodomicrobium]|uniref:hopanoid transporter HpnN n=1 Tax=Rhodomicrobium TaxID=1068 RepID=UPI000B4C12A3|nr:MULTISPECIES: MMPL family transporter [Rhodomicrobium]